MVMPAEIILTRFPYFVKSHQQSSVFYWDLFEMANIK